VFLPRPEANGKITLDFLDLAYGLRSGRVAPHALNESIHAFRNRQKFSRTLHAVYVLGAYGFTFVTISLLSFAAKFIDQSLRRFASLWQPPVVCAQHTERHVWAVVCLADTKGPPLEQTFMLPGLPHLHVDGSGDLFRKAIGMQHVSM
jgi:hypothetical protein